MLKLPIEYLSNYSSNLKYCFWIRDINTIISCYPNCVRSLNLYTLNTKVLYEWNNKKYCISIIYRSNRTVKLVLFDYKEKEGNIYKSITLINRNNFYFTTIGVLGSIYYLPPNIIIKRIGELIQYIKQPIVNINIDSDYSYPKCIITTSNHKWIIINIDRQWYPNAVYHQDWIVIKEDISNSSIYELGYLQEGKFYIWNDIPNVHKNFTLALVKLLINN